MKFNVGVRLTHPNPPRVSYPLPTSMGSREGERAGDGPKTERSAVMPLGRPRHALPTANLWVKGSLVQLGVDTTAVNQARYSCTSW